RACRPTTPAGRVSAARAGSSAQLCTYRSRSREALVEHLLDIERQPHVSNLLVRVLVEVLQRRGIGPEKLLGCAADALFSEPADGRTPLAEYQALIARAIALTEEPALGLQCGLLASESSFGLLSHLVAHAPSLRHAIELVSQFHGLLVDDVAIALDEHSGTAR